jgi:predicted RNA-binding protein with PUA-like domain
MTRSPRYWLVKSEPTAFSIDDLARAPRQTTCWDGVRNYQARNFLREMAIGDQVLFYHSNAEPPAVVGSAEVVKTAIQTIRNSTGAATTLIPQAPGSSPVGIWSI